MQKLHVRPLRKSGKAISAQRDGARARARYGVSIRVACLTFSISETCYRYQAKLSSENAVIADWLLRLTTTHKRWGFGLCYYYLRNTQGYGWNHKRIYRIYRELELNLRIKPRRRIKRDKPDALSVPDSINQVWSMDFMSDTLEFTLLSHLYVVTWSQSIPLLLPKFLSHFYYQV